MIVKNPFEELVEILKKLLETINIAEVPSEGNKILFEMLENALKHDLVGDFIDTLVPPGKSLEDLLRSVIIDHSRQHLEALVRSWVLDLQRPVQELLEAVNAVQQETLDEVCRIMMEMVARHMTEPERETARCIYGKTFNYDTIYLSEGNVINDVTFDVQKFFIGLQDFFAKKPNARAFVTFKLIHHDVAAGSLDDATLIHELCHVWQYQEVGPVYLIQAIHAQLTLGDPAAYNYGFTDSVNGNGGDTALKAAITNNPGLTTAEVFELFNREQQAKIIEHYYYRSIEHKKTHPTALNVAAWQPFKDLVYTPFDDPNEDPCA